MRRVVIAPAAHPVIFSHRQGRRGLRLALFGFVLLALTVPGIGSPAAGQKNRAEEVDLAALPREAREALDRAVRVYQEPLRGARWSRVYQLSGTDHSLFQLQGSNSRGNKIELEVTSAGRVIEVEEHGIPMSEVPRAV